MGRATELAALFALVAAGSPAVVTGEPGIGKTTLLRAAAAGRPVRVGGALGLLAAMPGLALRRAVGPLPGGDAALLARHVVNRMPPDGVLVLDDLHWADDTTLEVAARLAGRVPVLAGVRTGGDRATAVVAGLVGAGFERLALGPLGEDDTAAIAMRGRPGLGQAAARRLAILAGGNPLHVEELARDGVPTSLRLALAHRVRGLPPAARALVELLAVAGAPLVAAVVAEPDGTDEVLDRLAAAGLAMRVGERVEIRHALIADVVASSLPPARRVLAHRRAAAILEDPMLVARHLAAAGDRAAAARVAATAAADPARSAGERAVLLGIAAEHATGAGATATRLDAAARLADAAQFHDAERLVDLAIPRTPADRARALGIRARTRWGVGDGPGSIDAAEAALAEDGPGTDPLRPELLLERAWTVTLRRDGPRAVELAREALAAHRAASLPIGRAQRVLATALSISQVPMAEWGPLLRDALAEARSSADLAEELLCAKILAASEQVAGDPLEGRRVAEAAAVAAAGAGLVGWEQSLRSTRLSIDTALGDYSRVIRDGETLLEEPLEPRVRGQVAGSVALALVDLGRLEPAARLLQTSLGRAPDDPDGRFDLLHARVELALAGGDPSTALAHAEDALQRHGGAAYGDLRAMWVVRDWAALELGRGPWPPVADDRVHPFWTGAAPEREAIRELALGRPTAAAEAFAEAARRYDRYLVRAALRCRWGHGASLARAHRADAAAEILEAVEREADALGMAPLVGRVRRSLRLAGRRRAVARGRSGRLSAREQEVLDLVAAGHTNAQIAGRLGIGRPTVARLLANASDKLGTTSRTQAALESRREPV